MSQHNGTIHFSQREGRQMRHDTKFIAINPEKKSALTQRGITKESECKFYENLFAIEAIWSWDRNRGCRKGRLQNWNVVLNCKLLLRAC
jgi:hypothetical protein